MTWSKQAPSSSAAAARLNAPGPSGSTVWQGSRERASARLNLLNNTNPRRPTSPTPTTAASFLFWRKQCASIPPQQALRVVKLGGVLLLGGVSGMVWGLVAGRVRRELFRFGAAPWSVADGRK